MSARPDVHAGVGGGGEAGVGGVGVGELPAAPAERRSSPRRRPILWVAVAIGIVFAGFAVVAATGLDTDPTFEGGNLLGQPAPDVELVSFAGEPLRLSDLAGRVIVVNFWNDWCIPCRQEYPSLVAFHNRHLDDPDFAMVGILRASSQAAAEAWLADNPAGWLMVTDPGERASVDFGTIAQPETFVINPDGLVVGLQRGPVTFDDLEQMLAAGRGQLAVTDGAAADRGADRGAGG